MYAKGMSTRNTALLIALNAAETARFLTREDDEIDTQVLEDASQQVKTRKAALPDPDDIMIVTISLTEEEARKLREQDAEFEEHFLEIVTQQAENTKKDIDRFERQKAEGYVPSRRERRKVITS